ncbi:BrnT family toxin [Geotalea uraniireducens]|uniref:BrnT family toxin n=1 Tax=Geotalea uraniireducens (strain Rf4) TaxID=351605 RepID=A5G3T4_GEOUR|nr:BrnT family toxin [Geotalea uraniireducens]ABQ26452.1 protein of unknown function DUF497 [Geotalea uraniireducens Rf4]
MESIWDEQKNMSNKAKHGVSFETAALVFDDPLHLSMLDRIEGGEERWQTMGMVGNVVVLLVAHTFIEDDGEEVARIISARKATRKERKCYEQGHKETGR